MSLGTILGVVAVAFVVLLVLNRRAVLNMFSAARAQVGELGRLAKNADPLVMYKQVIDDGLDNIGKAKSSLETVRTQVRSLDRQTNDGRTEKTRLENRIRAALAGGDPNNTAFANAIQLESCERNLATNEEQLARTKGMYDNFTKTIELNQKKVQEARKEVQDLGIQLEQSEREKELVRFNAEFEKGVDVSGTLSEAREAVLRKIDANRAAGDVAADTSKQKAAELADEELERKQRADEILARFKTPASV